MPPLATASVPASVPASVQTPKPSLPADSKVNSVSNDESQGTPFHDDHLESQVKPLNSKGEVIVFLSKSCPHCVTYDKEKFPRLKGKLNKIAEGNVSVKKIYPDNDPEKLFEKYDIMFVPSAVVIHKDSNKKVSGEISPVNCLKTLHELNKTS